MKAPPGSGLVWFWMRTRRRHDRCTDGTCDGACDRSGTGLRAGGYGQAGGQHAVRARASDPQPVENVTARDRADATKTQQRPARTDARDWPRSVGPASGIGFRTIE